MTVGELIKALEMMADEKDEVVVRVRGRKYITEYVDRPTAGEFTIPVDLLDVVGDATDVQVGRIRGRLEVTAWV